MTEFVDKGRTFTTSCPGCRWVYGMPHEYDPDPDLCDECEAEGIREVMDKGLAAAFGRLNAELRAGMEDLAAWGWENRVFLVVWVISLVITLALL